MTMMMWLWWFVGKQVLHAIHWPHAHDSAALAGVCGPGKKLSRFCLFLFLNVSHHTHYSVIQTKLSPQRNVKTLHSALISSKKHFYFPGIQTMSCNDVELLKNCHKIAFFIIFSYQVQFGQHKGVLS